jgi:LysM repeat protein
MIVATLEGAGIVAAFGEARVIQPGAQTRLPLGGDSGLQVIGAPSEPEPFDILNIQRAPIVLLPEIITLPEPISLPGGVTVTSPPSQPSVIPTTSSTCVLRTDWTGTYNVRSGDTLSAIARRYNLSLQELQDGNCITDANRISVGQTLRVPLTSTVAPPSINASVVFTADSNSVEFGDCTTIRWNVTDANNVYFSDESVSFQGSQEVCPSQSATYVLLVVDAAGNQSPYTVNINVVTATEEALLCPNQVCDAGENPQTCPSDCTGAAGAVCGNQICEANSGENSQTCPRDCG